METILFFRAPAGGNATGAELLSCVAGSAETWAPAPFQLTPKGLGSLPFPVWWLFHYGRLFRNRGYRILLVRENGVIVHRTCVFPPFFRFPFMQPEDVQAGDIWTAETHRGRGIAVTVLKDLIRARPRGHVWFLCADSNTASVKLATSAGLALVGTGRREPRWGVGLFGRFVIRSRAGA